MARVCCVVQCSTKSGGQEFSGLSLFKINSESENYKSILNAVGSNLKQSKTPRKRIFICELHFAKECIIRTDIEIMKNGCQVLVPRKRLHLKKNSIPTIFPDQTQNGERKVLPAIKQKKLPSSSSTQNEDPTRGKKTNTGDQRVLPFCKFTAKTGEKSHKETQPTIDRQETKNTGYLFGTHPESKETYTQKQLIEDWRALIKDGKTPSHWAMCNSSHGVFFVYFGDDYKSTSRTILVNEDMSLEIRHHGHVANLPVLEKLRNFQDFFGVLITVTSSRICKGAYDIPCQNVFFIPKLRSKSNKCADCQKINKQLKNIISKREKRALLKQKKDKKFVANLKRKYKRVVNKVLNEKIHSKKFKLLKYLDMLGFRVQVSEFSVEEIAANPASFCQIQFFITQYSFLRNKIYYVKISKQTAEVEQLMQKSSVTDQPKLKNVIKDMPQKMQEAIRTFHSYAKKNG